MGILSILELLNKTPVPDYKKDKFSSELAALNFWNSNKGAKLPNGKMFARYHVAQHFGFSAGRMTDIIKNPNKIGSRAGSPLRIPLSEELKIVQWICQRCQAFIPTNSNQVVSKANVVVAIHNHFAVHTKRGPLTLSWYYCFYKRHSNQLARRRVQGLDISRQEGRSTARLIEYYSCLRDMMFENKFKQHKIYNLDETPCPVDNIPRYSIWHKSVKSVHITQSDNRQVLTMMACIAANGTSIPPLIIFQGKTIDINYLTEEMDILCASNDTAYMTAELFRSWANHFVEFSKPTIESPVLLLMDNFVAHLDWETLDMFHSHHIFICGLAPHTSDLTQPLDLSVFQAFKTAYRRRYNELLQQYKVKRLTQRDFTDIMAYAYRVAFTSNNITSGFQKAGILPFAPMNVLHTCDDWNLAIYNKYIPNEDSTEVDWRHMKNDPAVVDYKELELSNERHPLDLEPAVQIDEGTTEEEAINAGILN